MPPAPKSLPNLPANYTPQFYLTDVVTKLTDPTVRARVLRCWSDEEDIPLPELAGLPPGHIHHELTRPLVRGEVGISVGAGHISDLSIVPESTLVLFQREFNIGDIVKRSLSNVESAVVVGYDTEVQLEHAIDGRKVKGWVPWGKLRSDMAIEARYRVMYGEWVGIVDEVFEIGRVQHLTGSGEYFVRGSEGMMEVGRTVKETFGEDRGLRFPRDARPETDVITNIHPELVFVTWNAINQELPISEQDKYPEPPRIWRGADIKRLATLDSFRCAPVQLGVICRFRDPNDEICQSAPSWKPARSMLGSRSTDEGMKAFRVIESRSNVRLRWQDGKETSEWASGLVPYRNVDDYETWPGEHLVWRDDTGQRRPICIQSFNPHQRVAEVLFTDDQTSSTVSVLELDTGGPGKAEYGVGFGQQVLFTSDNAMPLPEVPTLGQTAPPPGWNRIKDDALGDLGFGWAEGMIHADPNIPEGDLGKYGWWGEVENLHLDGSISVRLPNGSIRKAGIKQLILLNDPLGEEFGPGGMMDLEGMGLEDEDWMDQDDFEGDEDEEEDDIQILNGNVWEPVLGAGGHSAAPTGVVNIEVNRAGSEMDVEEMLPAEEEDDGDITMRDGEAEAGPSNPSSSGLGLLGNQEWQSFDTLEEAPTDHHFYSEPRVGAAKSYLARLQKEHRALMTSLPENILVRTYEDRSDLMRVLIIGPEGTPYRDAPFIFDVYLSPSKFPHDPPSVFFHSHTNGKGRCNPNLYEDGKVCLSVLGTWAGEKSESWSPQNSSLLQVFVSISGLVLVRHPYHCEPAFAKLEGTSEGRVNSRLYSEKAFVLSRAFIRQALTHPPAGLEKELRHFYLKKGKLRAVIGHVKALMEKSTMEADVKEDDRKEDIGVEEKEEEWSEDAMGSLSVGAILTLKSTLGALEALANDEEAKR